MCEALEGCPTNQPESEVSDFGNLQDEWAIITRANTVRIIIKKIILF